jgi:hypothetical protein
MSSNKDVVHEYGDDRSLGGLPKWASTSLLAGAYQQGRAEALKYAFDEAMKRTQIQVR